MARCFVISLLWSWTPTVLQSYLCTWCACAGLVSHDRPTVLCTNSCASGCCIWGHRVRRDLDWKARHHRGQSFAKLHTGQKWKGYCIHQCGARSPCSVLACRHIPLVTSPLHVQVFTREQGSMCDQSRGRGLAPSSTHALYHGIRARTRCCMEGQCCIIDKQLWREEVTVVTELLF